MKKMFLTIMICFIFTLLIQDSKAGEYQTYQEIKFEQNGAMLLEDYSTDRYDKYYDKMTNSRFWGWRTFTGFENEKVEFIKETLYIIVNEGTTPITENIKFSSSEEIKKQYSVSGTIGMNVKGDAYGFKLGLEDQLKFSITTTVTSSFEEEFDIKVLVDPMTKLTVQIRGEGKVTNGVAKYYRFFKNVRKGGWEIFVVTTEYYSIVKEAINES